MTKKILLKHLYHNLVWCYVTSYVTMSKVHIPYHWTYSENRLLIVFAEQLAPKALQKSTVSHEKD